MTRWQGMADDRRRPAMVGAGVLGVVALVALVVLVTGGGGNVGSDGDVSASGPRKDKSALATTTTTTVPTTAPHATITVPPPTTTIAPPATVPPATTPPTTAPSAPPPPPPAPAAAGGPLCIGDSVMLGASPQHANTLSMCGAIDATESRQASDGPDALSAHQPYPSTVVVHLGTNGTVDGGDLDAMLSALQGVDRVVLVTVQHNGNRSWEGQANSEITAAAGRHANARVADWKGYSDGHPEWFAGDGIHLSAAGAQAYADVIAGALG
jgi:lysophospholipase L1-like esterase